MKENEKWIRYEKGKVYFTRELERKIFFFLTLIMLSAGVMFKIGLL
jgi:hypothetical protein